MAKATAGSIINHRSAITGRFVKESYAKTHKATTVTERNRASTTSKRTSQK